MPVTVNDLKEQTGAGPHPILVCLDCGAEYSANLGDYFLVPPTHVFTCCDVPMELRVKRVIYEEVSP